MSNRPLITSRRPSIAAISLVSAVALACAAGPAHAQSATAEALFDDGNKLMDAGKLAQACESFEASNRVEARAGTLIRLGECREQNHQLASAWSAYKDALGRVKDPRKRDLATQAVAALEPRLSYLTVSLAADAQLPALAITRDGKPFDVALLGVALPVDGGDYKLAAHAAGHQDWQTVAHVPEASGKIVIQIPKLHDGATVGVTQPPPPHPIAPVGPTPATQGTFTGRRKLALGVAGLTVIDLGVAVAVGVSAKSKQTDAFDQCPAGPTMCPNAGAASAATSLLSTAHSRATDANILYGVGAVLAVGAGVLWFTGAPQAERIAVVPSVAPGQAGLAVLGRF